MATPDQEIVDAVNGMSLINMLGDCVKFLVSPKRS
jgi:hypothetical protein